MIEGGGLGVVAPEDIGPMSVQVPNGVVDLLVPDEAAAVAAAQRYLSYVGGPGPGTRRPARRSARAAPPHPAEPGAQLRRAVRHRDAV